MNIACASCGEYLWPCDQLHQHSPSSKSDASLHPVISQHQSNGIPVSFTVSQIFCDQTKHHCTFEGKVPLHEILQFLNLWFVGFNEGISFLLESTFGIATHHHCLEHEKPWIYPQEFRGWSVGIHPHFFWCVSCVPLMILNSSTKFQTLFHIINNFLRITRGSLKVSHNFQTTISLYFNDLREFCYSHSIVPGGFDVMS